ncbi:SMP-30/gluconolactonase/LRE family protein [Nonomuraea sp. NPDC046570]|uniref:SMP-30/gluconolactonase/LRE family protein n=1 Tax=Nonomuraea sp. NPDC046570 TaxID=3155255 RepID=UPI0033E3F0D8
MKRIPLLLISIALLALVATPAHAAALRPVIVQPYADLAEGVTVGPNAEVYVGLLFKGEIRKVDATGTDSLLAALPVGEGRLNGLVTDRRGTVYALLNSGEAATNGVWRITPWGDAKLHAALPIGFANALAFGPDGALYVTDSAHGAIYRVAGGKATVWVKSPLLDPGADGVGANGIAWRSGAFYVAVSDQAQIVRIPYGKGGRAGTPAVHVKDTKLAGADGVAFDVRGQLYVPSYSGNTLSIIRTDGHVEVLADKLDGPASLAFDGKALYFVNIGGNGAPSLMKAKVKHPGLPLLRG